VRFSIAWLAWAIAGMAVTSAWGQQGSAVQLPTFSYFGLGTTVSVPDRGSVYLGGVKRATSGVRESGVPLLPSAPLRNRSFGTTTSASGASVSVYIHDFQAMDEYLRSQPPAGQALVSRDGAAAALSRPLALSPTEVARQRPVAPVDPQQEAEKLYGLGMEAQAQGNLGAAKVFYEMASRRATGELRERVLARLQVVSRLRGAGDGSGRAGAASAATVGRSDAR
jgi:hypothetical protein